MADVTSSGQVAELVKCKRLSLTDVIFVSMPVCLIPPFVFLSLLLLSLVPGFQNRN